MNTKQKTINLFLIIAFVFSLNPHAFSQEITNIQTMDVQVFQKEIMAKITGETEIVPGLKIPDRSTLENRKIARSYFDNVFKDLGYEPVRHPYSEEGENVYVILKASVSTDEYIILGAHYDSPGNAGANDNASGVAVVMAAAKQLKQTMNRSKNIIFVLFDQEERGLVGSRNFAKMIKEKNMNIHSVHTVDQMGWDEDDDRAFELEIPYKGAHDLYKKAIIDLKKDIQIHITQVRGSDHSAFRNLDYKAVGITEEFRNGDTSPHFHRPTDKYDTINFDYMESTTMIIIRVMQILSE